MLDPASFAAILLMLGGLVALSVGVPLVGAFLIDGVVAMVRGRGLRVFGLAAVSTLLTAVVGVVLLVSSRVVTHDPAGIGSTETGLSGVLVYLAPAMCVLGIVQSVRRVTGRRLS